MMAKSKTVCKKGHKKPLNKRCPVCYKEYQIRYKKENPDYWKRYNKKWRQDNKTQRDEYEKECRLYYRVEWLEYFKQKYGENPQCQICGKVLGWNVSCNAKTRVCFDHKTGQEPIKKSPRQWVQNKPFNPEHVATWESCDFGILCNQCNTRLPTKNRTEFIAGVLRYMGLTK